MASIIKSQIVKNLARYTKNLSVDNINVSLFKGEGEFLDIELEENVIHAVLQMPDWLRINSITCNRLAWKIPWTKLKTEPIRIHFDSINVDVSAIVSGSKRRKTVNLPSQINVNTQKGAPTKYGFIEKVIDSICMTINSVDIKFGSPGFRASLHATRIQLRSTNPAWRATDIRSSRIIHKKIGQVLIFKELLLATMKLEASIVTSDDEKPTPLRLITSQSSLKITIKKRLSDCGFICGRLELVLDDILWVMSEKQLKAAVAFVKSVLDVKRQSLQEERKNLKSVKASTTASSDFKTTIRDPLNYSDALIGVKPIDRLFSRYNILETSFHVATGTIDFHFCGGLSSKESSTMQVVFDKLSMDYYPKHIAGSARQHWLYGGDTCISRHTWVQQVLASFYDVNPQANLKKDALYEGALLMRLQDISISQLRASAKYEKGDMKKKPLLSSENTMKTQPALYLDYTFYFYDPSETKDEAVSESLVPSPNLFIQTAWIQCTIVDTTILWANAFINSVLSGWTSTSSNETVQKDEQLQYTCVKVDMERTTLTIDLPIKEKLKLKGFQNVPNALRIRISRIVATNSMLQRRACDTYKLSKFYLTKRSFRFAGFPNKKTDLQVLPDIFHFRELGPSKESEWVYEPAAPFWQVDCKKVGIDFATDDELSTLIKPVPIMLWIYSNKKSSNHKRKETVIQNSFEEETDVSIPDISVLVDIKEKMSIILTHMEYLFIIRLQSSLLELNRELGSSVDKSEKIGSTVCFGLLLNDLELGLLLPRSPCSDTCEVIVDNDLLAGEEDNVSDSTAGLPIAQEIEEAEEDFGILDESDEDVDIDEDGEKDGQIRNKSGLLIKSPSSHSLAVKTKGLSKSSSSSDLMSKSTKKGSSKLDQHIKKHPVAPTNTSTSGFLAAVLGNLGLAYSAVAATTVSTNIAQLDIKPITDFIDASKNDELDNSTSDTEEEGNVGQPSPDLISLAAFDEVDYFNYQVSADQLKKASRLNSFYGSISQLHKEACLVMIRIKHVELAVQILGPEMVIKFLSRYGTVSEIGNVDLTYFSGRKARVMSLPLKSCRDVSDAQVQGRITLCDGNVLARMKLNGLIGKLMTSNLTNMNAFFLDDTIDTVKPGMAFVFEIHHSSISIINDNSELTKFGLKVLPLKMLIRNSTMYRVSDAFENEIRQLVYTDSLEAVQNDEGSIDNQEEFQGDETDLINEMRNHTFADAKTSSVKDELPQATSKVSVDPYVDAPLSQCMDRAIVKQVVDKLREDNERLLHLLKITQSALKAKQEEQQSLIKTVHHLEDELVLSFRDQNRLLRLAADRT